MDLVKLWKIFHPEAGADVGLLEFLDRNTHQSTRGHSLKLAIPRCRTEIKRRFFNVRCVRVWNALPSSVVCAESVGAFKRGLCTAIPNELFEIP